MVSVKFSTVAEAIQAASSAQDVVRIVKEFLISLDERDTAQLPWGLREDVIERASDIALWALHLANDKSLPSSVAAGPAFGQVTRVFILAAARIVTIREHS